MEITNLQNWDDFDINKFYILSKEVRDLEDELLPQIDYSILDASENLHKEEDLLQANGMVINDDIMEMMKNVKEMEKKVLPQKSPFNHALYEAIKERQALEVDTIELVKTIEIEREEDQLSQYLLSPPVEKQPVTHIKRSNSIRRFFGTCADNLLAPHKPMLHNLIVY